MSKKRDDTIPTKRYYVYTLSDGDTPFYVGKGQGRRIHHHEEEAQSDCTCPKCDRIRSIWAAGQTVTKSIVFQSSDEAEVLQHECALIAQIGRESLCNRSNGGEPGGHREYVSVDTLRRQLRLEFKETILPTLSERDRLLFHRTLMRDWVNKQVARCIRETAEWKETVKRAREIAAYERISVYRIMPELRKRRK
jgi:hypothetical protein